MKGFLKKIADTDFRKPAKRLVILALAVVLGCGSLTAYLFRTQISQVAALERADAKSVQTTEKTAKQEDRDHGHDHDRDVGDLMDAGLVTRPSTAAIAAGITSIVLCGLCALAYWLMIAAWLYKAAAQAGMNRALWPILGLFGNLLAVLAFLIVRGRLAHCPACGAWQKPAPYCGSCGAKLQTVCPTCGRVCSIRETYCPSCGSALEKALEARAPTV